MSADGLTALFSFLFGLVLGSFLNVCIERLPKGRSVVRPASACPECGSAIRFYDNIPLLSYLVLRGRCRSCGRVISPRYPLVELITGLLSVALIAEYGAGPSFLFYLGFVSVLIVVSFIDLRHQIIPDVLSIPGVLTGLAFSLTPWGGPAWPEALVGAVAGGGFLLAVALVFERLTGKEGMGFGDVKLLAMIGAWLGWRALPFVVLISSLAGILIGGGALLLARRGLRVRIPFGPFLALGSLIHFFFGRELLQFYLGFV